MPHFCHLMCSKNKKSDKCLLHKHLSLPNCGRWDLNPHDHTTTRSLVLPVCQFQHSRSFFVSLKDKIHYSTFFHFVNSFFQIFLNFSNYFYDSEISYFYGNFAYFRVVISHYNLSHHYFMFIACFIRSSKIYSPFLKGCSSLCLSLAALGSK